MRIFSTLRRHSWYAARADAFADGELTPGEAARFEQHMAACDTCRAVVAEGRELRAIVARLPEVPVPRSFRLTPSMAASAKPAPALVPKAPLYLGLVRAGAALSVAALVSVVAFDALNSEDSGNGSRGGAAPASADYNAEDTAGSPGEALSDKAAATPQLAPANGAGVSGSGLATPTLVSSVPLVPSTGGVNVPSTNPTEVARSSAGTEDDDGAASSVGLEAGAPSPETDDEGPGALVFVLAAFAGVMVVALAAIEISRRTRRA